MKIDFPKDFQQELEGKINVRAEDVFDTLQSPDKTDRVSMRDLELHFALKRFPQLPEPYFLLAYGKKEEDQLQVNMAWKLRPDLHPEIERISPLNLLETFARKYGLALTIGSKTSPFFSEESVYLSQEEWERGVRVQSPKEHQYVQQTYLRTEIDDRGRRLDCALAYCIDIDRYREWGSGRLKD